MYCCLPVVNSRPPMTSSSYPWWINWPLYSEISFPLQHRQLDEPVCGNRLWAKEQVARFDQVARCNTKLFSWYWCVAPSEKDLVMGMIRKALDGVDPSGHQQQLQALHPGACPPVCGPSFNQPWRKPQRMRSGWSLEFSSGSFVQ